MIASILHVGHTLGYANYSLSSPSAPRLTILLRMTFFFVSPPPNQLIYIDEDKKTRKY